MSFHTDVHVGNTFSKQTQMQIVEENDTDPIGKIEILVGDDAQTDQYVFELGGWMYDTFVQLLTAVESILDNERSVVTDHNGPAYLVFKTRSAEAVDVTLCILLESVENPDGRLPEERTATVEKRSLVEALLNGASEYRETVVSLNPSLAGHEDMQTLDQLIDDTRSLLS